MCKIIKNKREFDAHLNIIGVDVVDDLGKDNSRHIPQLDNINFGCIFAVSGFVEVGARSFAKMISK